MGTLLSPVVVGRDSELASLTAALEKAIAGSGSTVVLTGEAGVGKTRLMARDELVVAAAELAAAGDLAREVQLTAVPPLVGIDPLLRAVNGLDPTEMIAEFRELSYHTIPQAAALLEAAEAVQLARDDAPAAAAEGWVIRRSGSAPRWRRSRPEVCRPRPRPAAPHCVVSVPRSVAAGS